jgi:hypothetical protein
MSDFEKASRKKLRFDTMRGALSVEDLWDLPLTARGKAVTNLDDIARGLHKQLKSGDDISFVIADRKSDETVQLKFDIVKHIIDVRVTEAKRALEDEERAARKQRILAIIADRQDEDLRKMPTEELQKALVSL